MSRTVRDTTLALAELERPAESQYSDDPTELVVIGECTIERDRAWVFFYTSDRYLKTRDIRYAPAGNALDIVNRHTGEVRVTCTAQPIEYYIEGHERRLANGWRCRPARRLSRLRDDN
jgi:hypothetical protein